MELCATAGVAAPATIKDPATTAAAFRDFIRIPFFGNVGRRRSCVAVYNEPWPGRKPGAPKFPTPHMRFPKERQRSRLGGGTGGDRLHRGQRPSRPQRVTSAARRTGWLPRATAFTGRTGRQDGGSGDSPSLPSGDFESDPAEFEDELDGQAGRSLSPAWKTAPAALLAERAAGSGEQEGRQSMAQVLLVAGLSAPTTWTVLPQALTGTWAGT
ncbi:hypothetical protein GCM10009549_40980 [Streptomyces thermoalcalitolerans]|uniref:Uncharacterized protein n=1 Tax=Streptomyces thermoalcalitolerans TaxID=65605 RepID=A0ABP3ZGS4_9ACTN